MIHATGDLSQCRFFRQPDAEYVAPITRFSHKTTDNIYYVNIMKIPYENLGIYCADCATGLLAEEKICSACGVHIYRLSLRQIDIEAARKIRT